MFGRDPGWEALDGDIECLCKILKVHPLTHEQMHYLLRVQNVRDSEMRLSCWGLDYEEAFIVMAVAMFYRALVHRIPSYLFYEDVGHAEKWIRSLTELGKNCAEPLRSQLEISKRRAFLSANKVHVCHVVGPWTKDAAFRPGHQDIILPDFDNTPTPRIRRACALAEGSILYVPFPYGSLAEPAHRGNSADRRRDKRSS